MEAIDAIRKHKTLYEADHGWDKTTLDALDTAIKALEQPTIEPNHIEYTESEMKILELMFRIINETIKTQNGYMDIDYVSFDGGDLYNLANKLGVEDY